MAGHWQEVARLFLAPQRRTFDRSPGGLPFFSRPRRRSLGVSSIFSTIPTIVSLSLPLIPVSAKSQVVLKCRFFKNRSSAFKAVPTIGRGIGIGRSHIPTTGREEGLGLHQKAQAARPKEAEGNCSG